MKESELKDKQYVNAERYKARILIHAKYATNKSLWPIWLFSLYHLEDNARIIEFGCGNGILWKANSFRINKSWHIELTDFSQGMIDSARAVIGPEHENISYRIVDLSNFAAGAQRYTNIIANHMLYHIDDREKAFRTIYDILEPHGEFCASTIGLNNMIEMKALVKDYTGNDNYSQVQGSIADRFSLENGAEQMSLVFDEVEKFEYIDSLEITDTGDLVNYILSCNDLVPGIIVLPEEQRDEFASYIDKIMKKKGKIHITKTSGTFIARRK